MDDAIKRSVERLFPELTGGYHLPRFARVVGVADAPAGASMCDDFRPRYAVDIEVLGQDGEADPAIPRLAGVPLPLPSGGEEMGMFAFPQEGTQVVVCFAYGSPGKPYIQTILPHGLSLPKVPKGDQVWQHSDAVQQRVDADGNWTRLTDGKIRDHSLEREVEALGNREKYQSHVQEVENHSTEEVGGIKRINALGALKLNSAGGATFAALDDMHQATGRDYNLVVGKTHNAAVSGDMQEKIKGLRKSVAGISQRLVAPKNHVGSESVNIFKILCDTLDLIEQLASEIASHVHGSSPPPTTASAFSADAVKAALLSAELGSVTI
jgi:uncharacterized protein involved in type VI secretion and phage assembly